jgi:hypothetical protein
MYSTTVPEPVLMKLTVAGQLLKKNSHTDFCGYPRDDYVADTGSQPDGGNL